MTRAVLLIGFTTLVCSGCGVVGSPVAPEYVGVAPIIERQKQREAAAAGRAGVPSSPAQPADDLPVPPVQSVGTGVGIR